MHRFFQKDTVALIRNFERLFRVPFPEPRDIAVLNTDLTEIEPVERRVDSLVRVDTDEGDFLLVLESQGKKDERKWGSWAYYLGYLREKYQCQPVLIVLSQSRSTARWAAQPIRFGLPGWASMTVRPLVLGPDNVPVIVDEDEAVQDPSLAALSAITHGKGAHAAAILRTLAAALERVEPESAAVLAMLVEAGLVDSEARKVWRELMSQMHYFFRHPVAEKVREEGREEGRVEDRAEMTLRILEWRGIVVPEGVRERVLGCSDAAQLTAWAERAVHVTEADRIFLDAPA
ncbi:hypothetical protein GCM10010431_47120 [Streptomyces kunmingensis]